MNWTSIEDKAGPSFVLWLGVLGIVVFILLVFQFMKVAERRRRIAELPSPEPLPGSASGSHSTSSIRMRTSETLSALPSATNVLSIDYRPSPFRPPWVVTDLPEDLEDAVTRLDVSDRYYHRQTPRQLLPVVVGFVNQYVPRISTTDPQTGEVSSVPFGEGALNFVLGGFRSEGPVYDDGTSQAGWTFYFVDRVAKLGCVVTVTAKEIELQYGHVVDVDVPYESLPDANARRNAEAELASASQISGSMTGAIQTLSEGASSDPLPSNATGETFTSAERIPDIARAIVAVRESDEAAKNKSLQIWVALPDTVLVYLRDPIVIADVDCSDPEAVKIRNLTGFKRLLGEWEERHVPLQRWTLNEVMSFYRGEQTLGSFAEYLSGPSIAERAQSWEIEVMRHIGIGLMRQHGVQVISSLESIIWSGVTSAQEEPVITGIEGTTHSNAILDAQILPNDLSPSEALEAAAVAIRLLAFIPSGESMARLHTLIDTLPNEELRDLAADYFSQRRRRALGVRFDPIEVMNFKERCERMGKTVEHIVPIAIKGYDVRDNLLKVFEKFGIPPQRVRVIAGKGNMITAAYLRTEHADTEALISIIPSPRQAIIGYFTGSAAATFAKRISHENSYSDQDLRDDLTLSDPWPELVKRLNHPLDEVTEFRVPGAEARDTDGFRSSDTGKFRVDSDASASGPAPIEIYTEERLIQDLRIIARRKIPALHRACVYLALLAEPARVDEVERLLRWLYRAFPNQHQFRSAIVEALEYASSEEVTLFLENRLAEEQGTKSSRNAETIAIMREVIARRRHEARPFVQPSITLPGIRERVRPSDTDSTQSVESTPAE